MKIFARGNTIPQHLKIWNTKLGDRQYWRLLDNGKPAPNQRPYTKRSDIEMHEPDCEIRSNPRGRPSTGFDRSEYNRKRQQTKEGRIKAREHNRRSRERKRKLVQLLDNASDSD